MSAYDNSPGEVEEMPSAKQLVKPDLKMGLLNRKRHMERQLEDINAAIKALDDYPEVAKVLELIGKASRY